MAETREVTSAPIVLVPGFWLGAWAWDEVAEALRADGHDVTALTLPGLGRRRRPVRDHPVGPRRRDLRSRPGGRGPGRARRPQRGRGAGYAASDRVPERIAAMVYVDSGPATGALEPDFNRVEKPLPSREELEGENLDGLSEEQFATFRRRYRYLSRAIRA